MRPNDSLWRGSLAALPTEPATAAYALALRSIALPVGARTKGLMVDVNALTAEERHLLDDGDLLPFWAQYWLTLANALCELSRRRAQAAVVIIPHEPARNTQCLELTVREVCAALASSAFAHPCGMILAWGVPPEQINKPRFPLPCAGAITTTVDGLAAVLFATEEDTGVLADWFE